MYRIAVTLVPLYTVKNIMTQNFLRYKYIRYRYSKLFYVQLVLNVVLVLNKTGQTLDITSCVGVAYSDGYDVSGVTPCSHTEEHACTETQPTTFRMLVQC